MSEMCNLSEGILEKGVAIGRFRGKELQARQTAQNLWGMGLSVENIAKAVGYPIDTVRHWLNEQSA